MQRHFVKLAVAEEITFVDQLRDRYMVIAPILRSAEALSGVLSALTDALDTPAYCLDRVAGGSSDISQ